MKKTKGITLVALVITIIILLILAGITISQLTGSGLFEKARLAEQKSKNAQEKENSILSNYENKIQEYIESSREASGTINITENGEYDVKNYATASVNVSDYFLTPLVYSSNGFITTTSATTYYTQTIQIPENVNEIYLYAIGSSTWGSANPTITGNIIKDTQIKLSKSGLISKVIEERNYQCYLKTNGEAGNITVKMNSAGKGQHYGQIIAFFNNVSNTNINN